MDEAAAVAASAGKAGMAQVSQALEALRLAWGDVYMFGFENGRYWAARPDAPGTGIHRADDPVELGSLLIDEFEAGQR